MELDSFFRVICDFAPLPIGHVHVLQRCLAASDLRIIFALTQERLVLALVRGQPNCNSARPYTP